MPALIELTASTLDPRGPVADEMTTLTWVLTWLGGAVFVFVVAVLVIGLVRGRRREVEPMPSDPESAAVSSGLKWLVGGGVVLPTVMVTLVFVLTLVAMRALSAERTEQTVLIEVTGHQWWWEVEYPRLGIVTANEIHIPVGRPVELQLESADVIHSFWVPALGGKLDLLPDKTNTMTIQADETGQYRGTCAEFCGLQHAKMAFVAVALGGAEYETWVEQQQQPAAPPTDDPARTGLDVFLDRGCGECHTVDGTDAGGEVGPDLTHLASRLTLAAATIPNTPDNLRQWVHDPDQFKEGTQMPSFPLTRDEMDSLLAYLGTLE